LVIAGAAFLPGGRTSPRCDALYVAWFRVKEPANSSLSIFQIEGRTRDERACCARTKSPLIAESVASAIPLVYAKISSNPAAGL